jgi:hypothetical protein
MDIEKTKKIGELKKKLYKKKITYRQYYDLLKELV